MGVLNQIFGQRGDVPVLPPPGFDQSGPDRDDEELLQTESVGGDAEIGGLAIALHYEAADGAVSQRAVLCRTYFPGPPGMLGGTCQLRNAYRSFRVDRIMALVDMNTGEVHEGAAIERFFAPFATAGAADERARNARALMRKAGPAVKLLAYLALADGYFHDLERGVILSFVRDNADQWIGDRVIEWSDIDVWIGGLRPRQGTAERAVRSLAADSEFFPIVAKAMIDLVKADGVVDPAEEKAVRAIIAAVRDETGPADNHSQEP